jgi:hypothetical protein
MGKASRLKAARRLSQDNPPPFMAAAREPLDPKVFEMMLSVYEAAAALTMPTQNPETVARFQLEPDGGSFHLTDRPTNRGFLEVTRQLREMGISNVQAYLARVMHFGEIIEAADRFKELIQPGSEEGTLMVDSCVYEAAATGVFHASLHRMGFDIDDVVARAFELASQRNA